LFCVFFAGLDKDSGFCGLFWMMIHTRCDVLFFILRDFTSLEGGVGRKVIYPI
jgi:hypothetical protein